MLIKKRFLWKILVDVLFVTSTFFYLFETVVYTIFLLCKLKKIVTYP